MQHYKFGVIKNATLIKKTELKDLVVFLSNDFTHIQYEAETKDGTHIEYTEFKDLLNYPNYNKRKIVGLKIICSNNDKSIDITFKSDIYLIKPETIKYYLRYEQQEWGFKFEDDLLQQLKDFKPYYNFLTYFNFLIAFPIFILIISFLYLGIDYILKLFELTGYTSIDYNKSSSSSNGSNIVGFIIWLPIYFLGLLLNISRNYLFPHIFIALGKQEKEYLKREKIVRLVFGVVILGIIINIFAQIIINNT